MNKVKSTDSGGFPFQLDDIRWMMGQNASSPAGIYQVLNTMLRSLGDNFIVYGCDLSLPATITEGLIMLDGELVWVDSHTKTDVNFVLVQTFDATGSKTFQDTNVYDTYEKNRATVTASSGGFAFANAPRLDSPSTTFKTFLELATDAETITGSDAERSVTPAGLQARIDDGIYKYATENYDTGAAPSPSAGEYAIGKNGNVLILSTGELQALVGDIRSVLGSVVAEGEVRANTGNIKSILGKFEGANAPKICGYVNNLASVITDKGQYELSAATGATGIFTITRTDAGAIPIGSIVNVSVSDINGGIIGYKAVTGTSISVYIRDHAGTLTDREFSVTAYW